MRITPRQHIQAAKKPKKANPMKFQRLVDRLKDKDRLTERDIQAGRDMIKKLQKQINSLVNKGKGATKQILGRRAGGVIRPKPTFKGKVLKPKPIKDKRGIGIAIRGIGKAFTKGN